MVLAYAENFCVISSYLWPPESKSEWCKCVHVERSEIWVKKCIFWSKNMFLACCKTFTHFSLSIRIDNNFLIIISCDSTICLLLSVYFKSKMWIFSFFLVKIPIFHTTSGIWKNFLLFLVTYEFTISIFLDSYAYLLRIAYFRSKKLYFCDFFDKNIIFSGCIGYAEIFSFVYGWI